MLFSLFRSLGLNFSLFSRLSTEKSQLEVQVEKYTMEKMREEIEANAKTQVDAVKHDLAVSNLEKDIVRLKMEAEHVVQAREIEEKNWKRAESDLKESIRTI